MRLSENFNLYEAGRSQIARRHAIDNSPPESVIPKLRQVAVHILEPLREMYGNPITPNSWYRSKKLNRMLNSSDTSQHLLGEAVDIELSGMSNLELYQYILEELDFDQLILEYHQPEQPFSGWVHISYRGHDNNRRQAFKLTK